LPRFRTERGGDDGHRSLHVHALAGRLLQAGRVLVGAGVGGGEAPVAHAVGLKAMEVAVEALPLPVVRFTGLPTWCEVDVHLAAAEDGPHTENVTEPVGCPRCRVGHRGQVVDRLAQLDDGVGRLGGGGGRGQGHVEALVGVASELARYLALPW